MPPNDRPAPSPASLVALVLILGLATLSLLEAGSQALLSQTQASGGVDAPSGLVSVLNRYLAAREHVLAHAARYLLLVIALPMLLIVFLRRLAAWQNWVRESMSGVVFAKEAATTRHPFARASDRTTVTQDAFLQHLFANPALAHQIVVGLDERARAVWWTDEVRSMHCQVMGQTGSGKTVSLLYPIAFQDARRGRSTLFLSAKGARDDEQMLCDIAAAAGRLHHFRRFTFDEVGGECDTYNPLHLAAGAHPRAVAERVFSTFAEDLDNSYYRDQARAMFLGLFEALASIGKPIHMMDMAAALESDAVLAYALSLVDEHHPAKVKVRATINKLGRDYDKTYSGLLAAVNRYDHPALNVYNPSIVLEELLPHGQGLVAFSLSANAYPFQARAIGQVVLQHIQQLGAARERLPKSERVPVYCYIDEVDQFAYPGLISAFNKLRSGGIALLIAHQSAADLMIVSPEFSAAIIDNTRTKFLCYQNNPTLCDDIAAMLGTKKSVKRTNRESVDGMLVKRSMLESSAREVDEFVVHPNIFKNLTQGQARMLQMGLPDEGVSSESLLSRLAARTPRAETISRSVGVNLAIMKELPRTPFPSPPPRDTTNGLGLFRMLVHGGPPC